MRGLRWRNKSKHKAKKKIRGRNRRKTKTILNVCTSENLYKILWSWQSSFLFAHSHDLGGSGGKNSGFVYRIHSSLCPHDMAAGSPREQGSGGSYSFYVLLLEDT
jgi:hypothetical protein